MIYHVSLVRWFEKQRTTEERHLVYEHRGIMGYTYIIMNIYIYINRVMIWLLSIYDSTKKTIPRAPPVDRGEARASRGTTQCERWKQGAKASWEAPWRRLVNNGIFMVNSG